MNFQVAIARSGRDRRGPDIEARQGGAQEQTRGLLLIGSEVGLLTLNFGGRVLDHVVGFPLVLCFSSCVRFSFGGVFCSFFGHFFFVPVEYSAWQRKAREYPYTS